jgi:hypothetical protein
MDPVWRVSAYGPATHRREGDHEQVDQLIRAIAHQNVVCTDTQLGGKSRPDLVGQRVGVTVNPGRCLQYRRSHGRGGAERRLVRCQAAVL